MDIKLDPSFPKNFDARKEWPECGLLHQPFLDQGRCGVCWAVSAAAVMSDRTCIANIANSTDLNLTQPQLSPMDLICGLYEHCDGGLINEAFAMWASRGVVTGGPWLD